jgi:membrane protease YdiL (CAAX protease family)
MDDKELHKKNEKPESSESDWMFCPICGHDLPKIQNLKFCTKCGTNIKYVKENKRLPASSSLNPYKSRAPYPQYQPPPIYYGPPKISDEELIDNKEHKLWGTKHSIGLALGAFLLMDLIVTGFLMFITFITLDVDIIYDIVSNTYFLSLISLFELIFILVPVIYVKKYLKNPSFKNGLILLGFTSRGYDRKNVFKEVLIGLGFAVIGLLLVSFVSILIEVLLEITFRIEIVQDSSELTNIGIPMDIPSLIVFAIVMILVIGTSEEILFRGFMQKGLVRSLGSKWGIIVTAIIFSLIHLIGIFVFVLDSLVVFLVTFLMSFLPYFAISLMLGYLYHLRNENLIAVVIMHGVYDALTIILAYLIFVVF